MATGGDYGITDNIIVRLAKAISAKHVESIAIEYMGIEGETLENLRRQHREDVEAFSRDVLRKWCCMNSGPDETKVRSGSRKTMALKKVIFRRNFWRVMAL